MIDIHCHIIPGTDDGATTLDDALMMAQMAEDSGVTAIVATPHANNPFQQRMNYADNAFSEKLSMLRRAASDIGIRIKILSGMEIFASVEIMDKIESGQLIGINNSEYYLIEFAMNEYPEKVYRTAAEVVASGRTPVVAHPERYLCIHDFPQLAHDLCSAGALLQVNKASVAGKFGVRVRQAALNIISSGLASVIASDAHSPFSRTTNMAAEYEYISEQFGAQYADMLFNVNPQRIIDNKKTERFI